MKRFYVLFLILIFSELTSAQLDTTVFYPINKGNKWEYFGLVDTKSIKMTIESIGDTLFPSGKTYQHFQNITYYGTPSPYDYYVRYDTSTHIMYEALRTPDSCLNTEYAVYKFYVPDSTTWDLCDAFSNATGRGKLSTYVGYLNGLEGPFVFNIYDYIKIEGNQIIWSPMGSGETDYLVNGVGLARILYWDFAEFNLAAFKINGVQYGTFTNIKTEQHEELIFAMMQNWPNPFNGTTMINYYFGEPLNTTPGQQTTAHKVTIKVYNTLGKEIAVLLNETKPSGSYQVTFNTSEYNLPSGIYFTRLTVDNKSIIKKMVYLK